MIFYDIGSSSIEVALVKYSTYRCEVAWSCCCGGGGCAASLCFGVPCSEADAWQEVQCNVVIGLKQRPLSLSSISPENSFKNTLLVCAAQHALLRTPSAKEPGSSKPKTINQFEVLDADWDAELGATDLDLLLVHHFAEKFSEKTGLGDVR